MRLFLLILLLPVLCSSYNLTCHIFKKDMITGKTLADPEDVVFDKFNNSCPLRLSFTRNQDGTMSAQLYSELMPRFVHTDDFCEDNKWKIEYAEGSISANEYCGCGHTSCSSLEQAEERWNSMKNEVMGLEFKHIRTCVDLVGYNRKTKTGMKGNVTCEGVCTLYIDIDAETKSSETVHSRCEDAEDAKKEHRSCKPECHERTIVGRDKYVTYNCMSDNYLSMEQIEEKIKEAKELYDKSPPTCKENAERSSSFIFFVIITSFVVGA